MKPLTLTIALTAHSLALVAATATSAFADEPAGGATPNTGGEDGQGQGQAQGGQGVTVVQLPPQVNYPGALPPQNFDPNGHLGVGARPTLDINKGDTLDDRSGGPSSVRGSSNGAYIVEGQGQSTTPEGHLVRRGDTLWEISSRYFQNPYTWPRVWSFNPQIQNPHWIYPGDRVRLRDDNPGPNRASIGFQRHRSVVPSQTVFLRDMGWVDDKTDETWGEVVGASADHMFLSNGDETYLQLADGHDVQVGDELTVFRPIRTVQSENASGEMVAILGTVKVDRYNAKLKMVRARVIETIEVIERGAKVGPVGRKFDMVPPVVSDVELEANILASVYPNQVFGQNQVIFIDKGAKEGVRPGQRFFAMRRGDRWAQNIHAAGTLAVKRPRVEDDRPAQVDTMRTATDTDSLPDETYAELRVLRVRDHTCTALVIASKHEIERNARLVSRKGL